MRLLKALRREPVDRTPVWFMRQAGRYMPEYRELRKRYSMLELCETPRLAAEVTLQPIRRYPGLDAAIIFSDILLLVRSMGARLEFVPSGGPTIRNPVAGTSDIERLTPVIPERDLAPVLEAIRIVKRDLNVPLIGFAGAPFTLASYLIEGGSSKDFTRTRALMGTPAWPQLMEKLAQAVSAHLRAQISAGADAVQVFDSWVGNLTPEEYCEHVLPHMRSIFDGLGAPSIHFGTRTTPLLEAMREAGGDALGVDWRIPLDEAWARIGNRAIQGNLDPEALLGPRDKLLRKVDDILSRAGGRPGHIFNLGHGILPSTPMESVDAVIERVHGARAS